MLDINEIVRDRERIEKALLKRTDRVDFTEVIGLHEKRKAVRTDVDRKRNERNVLSAEIPKMMKSNGPVEETKARVKKIAEEIAAGEKEYKDLSDRIHDILAYMPNIPEEEVPAGGKENNEPLEYFGEKPEFGFKAKDHVDLATSLNLVDFERGVKMGGAGKWLYWGDGALLEWALINYFIDRHRKSGFTFVLPPHLLRTEAGYNAGQFPKFKDDVFYVNSGAGAAAEYSHFLLPTAETALANLFAGEIIPEEKLPVMMFGYTPCYRSEAGGYRTSERGTVRGNQFNKVEIFAVAHPDRSDEQFREIVKRASALVEGLGLHFRVTRLAAGDCSEAMSKTYDLEVWMPSMNEYKEVSSVSNAHTFQSIRADIRFRPKEGKQTRYVHTLNGSGLATSRVFPAILEQFQREDGRVRIPDALQPYMGKEYLEKPA